MYAYIRNLLFLFDAERMHRLVLSGLRLIYLIPGIGALMRALFVYRDPALASTVMGIRFPNPVGLAAGFDKYGRCVRPLLDLGFGFIEAGTVTPVKQKGNPRKRLYRLPRQHALINRMGFPSKGVDRFVRRLVENPRHGRLGINIGKNKNTANEEAAEDYLRCLRTVYTYGDYVAINISSPNTPGLRALQEGEALDRLLGELKTEQLMLGKTRRIYVPLAVKLSPDLSDEALDEIAELALKHKIDAIIATNTTMMRTGVENELLSSEAGGLSGRPLKLRATQVVRRLYNHLQGQVAIIGVGGIENDEDAWERMVAGADLVQVYTGFIYEGPLIAKRINAGIARRIHGTGATNLAEALEKARSGEHLIR